jgi:hypothetical protein
MGAFDRTFLVLPEAMWWKVKQTLWRPGIATLREKPKMEENYEDSNEWW